MKIRYTKQFKKDYKRVKKQKKDLVRIKTVIELLSAGQTLDPSYLDHPLTGNWNIHRDCHLESDWKRIGFIRVDTGDLRWIQNFSYHFS